MRNGAWSVRLCDFEPKIVNANGCQGKKVTPSHNPTEYRLEAVSCASKGERNVRSTQDHSASTRAAGTNSRRADAFLIAIWSACSRANRTRSTPRNDQTMSVLTGHPCHISRGAARK